MVMNPVSFVVFEDMVGIVVVPVLVYTERKKKC